MGKYKAISFRLNIEDLQEKRLYELIMQESCKHGSCAVFVKYVLGDYFNTKIMKEKDETFYQKVLEILDTFQANMCEKMRTEISQQGMELVGALLRGLGTGIKIGYEETEKTANVPDASDEFPDFLNDLLETYAD